MLATKLLQYYYNLQLRVTGKRYVDVKSFKGIIAVLSSIFPLIKDVDHEANRATK